MVSEHTQYWGSLVLSKWTIPIPGHPEVWALMPAAGETTSSPCFLVGTNDHNSPGQGHQRVLLRDKGWTGASAPPAIRTQATYIN